MCENKRTSGVACERLRVRRIGMNSQRMKDEVKVCRMRENEREDEGGRKEMREAMTVLTVVQTICHLV